MHTARQLEADLFEIEIERQSSTLADLFPNWGPLDRFGVVVHEPFGATGASYLLQSAIVAFYTERPARRDRNNPIYPEVYLFHVGGRFGDHASFDVYPTRKEIFVENQPPAVLNAINDRGITWLAVPDRHVEAVQHDFKEPAQALDRIAGAFAYSSTGRVDEADVTITARRRVAEANMKMTLHPQQSYHEQQQMMAALGTVTIPEDERFTFPESREGEVGPETRDRIRDARSLLRSERGWTEEYRRIPVRDSLRMLHRGPATAFVPPPVFGDVGS